MWVALNRMKGRMNGQFLVCHGKGGWFRESTRLISAIFVRRFLCRELQTFGNGRNMKTALRLTVSAILLLGLRVSAADAVVFDVREDFSISENPAGPWSYGWFQTLKSPFQLHTNSGHNPGGIVRLVDLVVARGSCATRGLPQLEQLGSSTLA